MTENAYVKNEERIEMLKDLAKEALIKLLELASELKIDAESLLRILAGVQGIDPELGRRIELLWQIKFGTVKVPAPKPELIPDEKFEPLPTEPEPEFETIELPKETGICSAFVYLDQMFGKKDPYKIPNHKDILTELIDSSEYDDALTRVRGDINEELEDFFANELNILPAINISPSTTPECPEFRRYELEILDTNTNEPLYGLKYSQGIAKFFGKLPVDKIVSILKREGVWE